VKVTAGAVSAADKRAVQPPSSTHADPLANDAAAEQRKATSSATSAGSISRLMAGSASMMSVTTRSAGMSCSLACSLICRSTSGVRT
jgi:hypothetical protein